MRLFAGAMLEIIGDEVQDGEVSENSADLMMKACRHYCPTSGRIAILRRLGTLRLDLQQSL